MKIGDNVKFVNDKDLYSDPEWISEKVNTPIINNIYSIRGFSAWGGLLLNEIKNAIYAVNGQTGELGFAEERFEVVIIKECKTIDDVLDKISDFGMSSLTTVELKILRSKAW